MTALDKVAGLLKQKGNVLQNVTIASGASLSSIIKTNGRRLGSVAVPSSWTTSNITFKGDQGDGTYRDIYTDLSSDILELVAEPGASISLYEDAACLFEPFQNIKLQSAGSGGGGSVAQGDTRTLVVTLK